MPQSQFGKLLLFDYLPAVSSPAQFEPRLSTTLVEHPDAPVLDHQVELDRGDVDPLAVGDGASFFRFMIRTASGISPAFGPAP